MKFYEAETLPLFSTFVDDDVKRYIRVDPQGVPLWYKATDTGFTLIENKTYYIELEKAYHEQEQQASKEQGDSTEIYLLTQEGAEGSTKH
jgi:hypothetical protein